MSQQCLDNVFLVTNLTNYVYTDGQSVNVELKEKIICQLIIVISDQGKVFLMSRSMSPWDITENAGSARSVSLNQEQVGRVSYKMEQEQVDSVNHSKDQELVDSVNHFVDKEDQRDHYKVTS